MKLKEELIETSEYTAIGVESEDDFIKIGILVLEPTNKTSLKVGDFEIYLTDDLIGKKTVIVVTEREFEIV
jgi:hypothetical protein